ncbi:MAG: peptidoglycan DD-metalloendopeptidase family protein [Nanoarchaeota archaeon]|nr:peptidoglycan DD-metalloendopeptidase family protein [Nanoarchaeota archaeon]
MKKSTIGILVLILLVVPMAHGLTIGSVSVTGVDENTIEVNWTSDIASDSKVLFGQTTLDSVEYSSIVQSLHSIKLIGLQPDTEYFVVVESSDGSNIERNDNGGNYYIGKTKPTVLFNNIGVENVGTNTVDIKWETDKDTSGKVIYGLSSNLELSASNNVLATNHTISLSGLVNGTKYFYKVVADYAESEIKEFTTRSDISQPDITEIYIPEYYNKNSINIQGKTKPGSEVKLYLEDRFIRAGTARSTGDFSFNYVNLEKDVNKIKLQVIDTYGEEFEKEYTITIDTIAPNISLKNLPESIKQASIKLDGEVNEPVELTIKVGNKTVSFNTSNKISQTLTFSEGDNDVHILARDRAGNVWEVKRRIYSDSKDPSFDMVDREGKVISISSYSPSISKIIRLRGKATEQAEIIIKVNERTYKTATKADFTWEQQIELERKVVSTGDIGPNIPPMEQRIELAERYANTIEVHAVDRSGRESPKKSGTVYYQLCGKGGDWDIVISPPNPGALSPIDLQRGYGMLGFEIDLVWQGGGDASKAKISGRPTIRKFTQISSELRKEYNMDLIGTIHKDFLKNKGYVTINLGKTDDVEEFETLKFPLEIDIPYSYDEFGKQVSARQTTCFTIEILVDKTFDESKIPEGFVKSSIKFLNSTIEVLDKVIDPLKKVEKFVFIGCKAMQLRSIFDRAKEVRACFPFKNRIPLTVMKPAKAVKDVEDCSNVLSSSLNSGFPAGDVKSLCESCMVAKQGAEKAKHEMALICDRYTCPTVPTVQYYSRINEENKKKTTTTKLYYAPNSGFSLQSNCDINTITSLANDMKDGKLEGSEKDKYKTCEKEYEFLWGPGTLTEQNKIFEKSAKLSAPDDVRSNMNTGGLFNTISSLCGEAKKSVDSRKLWIDNREFTFDGKDKSWAVTDSVPVGTSKDKQEQILKSTNTVTRYGDWFYYNFEPNLASAYGEVPLDVMGKNKIVLYNPVKAPVERPDSPKNVELAVNKDGVLFYKKTTAEKKSWWVPDQTSRSIISSSTGRPLELNQLKTEFERQENSGKWLIESTDGLLSSIQTVCVPGIISHMENLKTVSEQLKRCFQNLLINDEFRAGYCKSLIAEHVCDLVFNLIRCSFKVFEGKPRETRIQAGVPGFFSALSSAGGEVNKDIRERYGSTLTFDAIFNDRKLVHQMCLGAFNHDWDFNIETMLEETRQRAVPIKPDVFVFPTEYKYYGFNPLNGRSNIMYHAGLGIVAGADMDYEVNLICSNDNSCSDADGFAGGRCDCSYEGRGEIKKNIVRDRLTKGESNWDDADSSDIRKLLKDLQYRFDKIEVKWRYKDAKGQTVTDSVVKDLRLTGGLPSEGCKFDIISNEFRCLFGFGTDGYAKFVGDVKPLQTTFQVGDPIKFKGRIDKYSPEGESNRNVVLRAEVYNDAGDRIDSTGGRLEFNMREDKRYYLETDFAERGVPGYVVKQEDFVKFGSTSTGIFNSNKGTSSKFWEVYPSPYLALVSGDIGTATVKVEFTDKEYEIKTSSYVRGSTRGIIPDGNLVIQVGSGTIILKDAKNKRQVGEILSFEPPRTHVNPKYKVKLSLHTTDATGTPNAESIDEIEVEVTVRSSFSGSTCTTDGRKAYGECDCNGDGVKECGKSGGNQYCYKIYDSTTKKVAEKASCNKYPLCRQGEVTEICDCNEDGMLSVDLSSSRAVESINFGLLKYGANKEHTYNNFKIYRDSEGNKELLFYIDGSGQRKYLGAEWDSVTFNSGDYDGTTFKYKGQDINYKGSEFFYISEEGITRKGHRIIVDRIQNERLVKDSTDEDFGEFDLDLDAFEDEPDTKIDSYVELFRRWSEIVLKSDKTSSCEGTEYKYCFSKVCYGEDINSNPAGGTTTSTTLQSVSKIGVDWNEPIKREDLRTVGSKWDPFNHPYDVDRYSATMYTHRWQSIHRGMDIYTNRNNAPVYASADGEVIRISNTVVYVLHKGVGGEYTGCYVHVTNPAVAVGQNVKKGDKIAEINYDPPHLHFEIYNRRITTAAPSSKFGSSGAQLLDNDKYLINPIDIIGDYGGK